MSVKFPEWAKFLFDPYRYKVAHGGRGSSKSWTYARALILLAAQGGERILCTREVQKSIKDSVHRLLCDQIEQMGLGSKFDILDTEIRGPEGSVFLFTGLADQTAESIKSFEGITRCWPEEAQNIKKRSWDILIPTIRGKTPQGTDSEIWITFNPELDTDETWVRFVEKTPPNSKVVQVNYTLNPWFPDVLEAERAHCEATAPADYRNIWLGECRAAAEGAIYASEVAKLQSDGRVCPVPYDPRLKAHTVWDLGYNDSMVISIVQKGGPGDIRIVDYVEDDHKPIDWYLAGLKERRWNWGFDWLPHDGQQKNVQTGKSVEDLVRAFGRQPRQVPNIPVETGIKAARMLLPMCYFNKVERKTPMGRLDGPLRLLECLKRYKRNISRTGEPGLPAHDEFSHGADCFRYLAVVAPQLKNEDFFETGVQFQDFGCLDSDVGY